MIRPLRQRHRRMFAVLGVLLPVALTGGLLARKAVPSASTLPIGLSPAQPGHFTTEWERNDLFLTNAISVQLLRDAANAHREAVAFSAPDNWVKPDLMVYWITGNSGTGEMLPDTAQLLGTFTAAALPLPETAATTEGRLVLYSLADNEIVDVSKAFAPAAVKASTTAQK